MINVAIVEDDKKAAERLSSFFSKYGAEHGIEFRTVHFESSVNFLSVYSCDYELIMMDIDMPEMNGMELVRRIRERDTEVMIIFVTNLAQYAVKGYEVDAFDFMVKPVTYAEFSMKMLRAVNCMRQRQGRNIWVSTRGGKKSRQHRKADVRRGDEALHNFPYGRGLNGVQRHARRNKGAARRPSFCAMQPLLPRQYEIYNRSQRDRSRHNERKAGHLEDAPKGIFAGIQQLYCRRG